MKAGLRHRTLAQWIFYEFIIVVVGEIVKGVYSQKQRLHFIE
jgi:hypothetical protein